MMRLKNAVLVYLGCYILSSGANAFAAGTVDITCHNRIGGTWNFGTAPSSCNVSPLANSVELQNQFSPIIFQDSKSNTTGRTEYMSAMYPVLRDTGAYYIKRRNPNVSDAEVAGFLDALYALAEQETLWTHYRKGSDGVLRYMRGDNLHGHGFMQIDDRSHVAALKQGKGVDLIYNLIYGLDVYYKGWAQSARASCVSSSGNFHDRARAAWAAYNGGPGAICRWKANGRTDRDFNVRFTRKAWLSFVSNPQGPSHLNINCLVEGVRPCEMIRGGPRRFSDSPLQVEQ